jgi:hypothetical protein
MCDSALSGADLGRHKREFGMRIAIPFRGTSGDSIRLDGDTQHRSSKVRCCRIRSSTLAVRTRPVTNANATLFAAAVLAVPSKRRGQTPDLIHQWFRNKGAVYSLAIRTAQRPAAPRDLLARSTREAAPAVRLPGRLRELAPICSDFLNLRAVH